MVLNSWITRRLMDRLVVSLSRLLAPSDKDVLSEVVNDFAQDRAEATLTPCPAVAVSSDGECIDVLITSIDVQSGPDFVKLVLRSVQSNSSEVALTHRELRQWLSIVRRAYQEADWSIDHWPAWLLSRRTNTNSAQAN